MSFFFTKRSTSWVIYGTQKKSYLISKRSLKGDKIPKYRILEGMFNTLDLILFIDFWCLTPLSAISWRPVYVVEEAGVPRENHRPWASNW